jgi:hypothetical protein
MEEIICKIEQISWLKDPQWWAIFAALLLGLSGIFQDKIRRIFWKPKLNVDFRLSPPDSHKIPMREIASQRILYNTYYIRARVMNFGNYQLEDVEAMVTDLTKKELNGQFKKEENFLPLNLVWANTHEITKSKIQPKLFKFLDFGHISETKNINLKDFNSPTSSKVVLLLDVEVAPNTGSHIIFPGEYRIKLIFAANNLSPVEKIYSLVIADEWTEDQQEMLEKNIFIKEEKSMY